MKKYKKLIIPEDSAWDRKSIWGKLPSWLKEFLTGCKNLIKWSPTIWKQRDWDHTFIFEISIVYIFFKNIQNSVI